MGISSLWFHETPLKAFGCAYACSLVKQTQRKQKTVQGTKYDKIKKNMQKQLRLILRERRFEILT